jgi:hypothetical protein
VLSIGHFWPVFEAAGVGRAGHVGGTGEAHCARAASPNGMTNAAAAPAPSGLMQARHEPGHALPRPRRILFGGSRGQDPLRCPVTGQIRSRGYQHMSVPEELLLAGAYVSPAGF